MTRQQKLDAFAKRKGYPSYFKYRDAVAKSEGFSSYTAKRRSQLVAKAVRRFPTPDVGLAASENAALDMTRDIRMAYRQAGRTAVDQSLQASRISTNKERTDFKRDQLTRPVIQSLDDLDIQVKDYYTNSFPKIYAAGARAADPSWKGDKADREAAEKLLKEGAGSLLQNNQAAKRNVRKKIPEFLAAAPGKSFKEANRRPIKGVKFKNGTEVGFEQYAEMVLRANAATAYNTGFLRAAQKKGNSLFICRDGDACGWTSHRDSERANGKVVTIEDALAHPIGHPNCVRTFSTAPKGTPHPRGNLFKREVTAVKKQVLDSVKDSLYQEALSLATHIVTDKTIREAAIRSYIAGAQDFQQFKRNIEDRARLFEHARKTRAASFGNVVDIDTRLPPVVSQKDVADDVVAWMDDFADGRAVPDHVLQILGVEAQEQVVLNKAVGDSMDRFNTMYNMSYRPEGPGQQQLWGPGRLVNERRRSEAGFGAEPSARRLRPIGPGGGGGDDGGDDNLLVKEVKKRIRKGTGKLLTPADYAQERAANAFYSWLGPRVPEAKYARLTFPNISRLKLDPRTGGILPGQGSPFLGRPVRLQAALGNLGKVSATSIRNRGVINHLSLNPNGLLRLSFARDVNGVITPTFRVIPKGPLRLQTKVNRGVRGNITSLSTEFRFITKNIPLVSNISARFSLNLRKLGLNTLADCRRVTAAQILDFNREDIRGVAIAAGLRIKGLNLFDIAHTFRLPWEEAMKVWTLSNAFLSSQRTNLKYEAKAVKKFTLVQGGKIQHLIGGETTSETARKRITVLDPTLAAPGGAPSQAQQIKIPNSLKRVAERRAYVENRLNAFEQLRIQNLRSAGDYSTIRFLRDTDKLTFEDIAYRMNMSMAQVERIYRKGTSGDITPVKPSRKPVPKAGALNPAPTQTRFRPAEPLGTGRDAPLVKTVNPEPEQLRELALDKIARTTATQGRVISVPSSLKTPAARRRWIEDSMTPYERDRVALLRQQGEVSAIKHLRDVDKLSWEQISVEMRMTIQKAKSLYGTKVIGPVAKEVPKVSPALTGKAALEAMRDQFGTTPLEFITDENRLAIAYYRSVGHEEIHKLLRGLISTEGIDTLDATGVADVLKALNKDFDTIEKLERTMEPIRENIKIYRAVESSRVFGTDGRKLRRGQRFADQSFTTGTVKAPSGGPSELNPFADIIMEIDVPKGTEGVFFGGKNGDILLSRNLTFEVDKWDGTNKILKVKVVPFDETKALIRGNAPRSGTVFRNE